MEILTQGRPWLLCLHVVASVLWLGMLWYMVAVDVHARGVLEKDQNDKVVPLLWPRCMWWLRWGGAVSWLSGLVLVWWAAGAAGQGALEWLGSARGRWYALGGVYATALLWQSWFVSWPRLRRVVLFHVKGENPPERIELTTAALDRLRLGAMLSLPALLTMVFANGAGADTGVGVFALQAAVVTAVGALAALLLLNRVGPKVGRGFEPRIFVDYPLGGKHHE